MVPYLNLPLDDLVYLSGAGYLIDQFLDGYEQGKQRGIEIFADSFLGKLTGAVLLLCILAIVLVGPLWILHKKKKRNELYKLLTNNDIQHLFENNELAFMAGVYVSKLMDIESAHKSGALSEEKRSQQIRVIVSKIY